MTISSRSLTVHGNSRGFLLNDLRELIRETDGLPGDIQVSVVEGRSGIEPSVAYAVVTWREGEDGPVKVV